MATYADQIAAELRRPDGGIPSAAQISAARTVADRFSAAGYHLPMIRAALANAYAESSLNPLAIGDQGRSVGLFQLYDKGAGAGMSVELRQNAAANTDRIIQEVNNYGKKRLLPAYASGKDAATLADLFCQDIERPADAAQKGAMRAGYARIMFPQTWQLGIDPSIQTPPPGAQPGAQPSAPIAQDTSGGKKLLLLATIAGVIYGLSR